MRTIKLLLAAGFLLVLGTSAYAQVQRNETYLPWREWSDTVTYRF